MHGIEKTSCLRVFVFSYNHTHFFFDYKKLTELLLTIEATGLGNELTLAAGGVEEHVVVSGARL